MRLLAVARLAVVATALTALTSTQTARGATTPPPAAPQPDLAPEASQRMTEAARDHAPAPWQREFMVGMKRGSHPNPSQTFAQQQAASADGYWAQEPPPGARYAPTAIYDPVRDRMLVFGGCGEAGSFQDVWALSLTGSPAWVSVVPSGPAPSGRFDHTAIYDPVRDRVVVFGGHDGSSLLNDVWVLSLAGSPAWTQLIPAGPLPSPRYLSSATYDPVRDRMVVFGGLGPEYLNDVWALSLAGSPAWTILTPTGAPPIKRFGHTAIFDPVRDRMVVFGGYSQGFLNDVWALMLADIPAWTQLSPSGTPPLARRNHTAIYDPVRDGMLMFGGAGVSDRNDVWLLSLAGSSAWAQLMPANLPPTARRDHSAIYDPVRDRMLMFGGASATYLNDVWSLSQGASPAWTQFAPVGTPQKGRVGHTAIRDPVRDRMVVFGGYDGNSILNEVSALSLATSGHWTPLNPVGPPPGAHSWHTAIHDPMRDRMMVFGGYDGNSFVNDVWTLSLAGSGAWTPLSPAGPPPSARAAPTSIYDPVRDRMVVFGGFGPGYLNDVWELSLGDSPAWTQLIPAGPLPSPRYLTSATYDPVRDRLLMFGGSEPAGFLNDVWALSLAGSPAWTQLTPAGPLPAGRERHTAIYDPVRDRMVVFGGIEGSSGTRGSNSVWSLSPTDSPTWTELGPVAVGALPHQRYNASAIYDPARDRMVVFGGQYHDREYHQLNDVWDLKWDPTLSAPPRAGGDAPWLGHAYPNPSRSDISIGFELPRVSRASLRVYDVSGRVVRIFVDGYLPAGPHSVRWDRRVASGALAQPGLYFYELRVDGDRLARRMVLIR